MAKLDLNVAGRPFVNEGPLVQATLLAAVVLAVASFANVYSFFGALDEARTLSARLTAVRAEAELARMEAKRAEERVSPGEKRRLRSVAASMIGLIEKRRLSWSRLFDQLEVILPRDVRVLTITPDVSGDRILLAMDAVARDNEAKLKFYGKLQEPPFRDAYILGTSDDGGVIRFQVRCDYDVRGPEATPVHEPMPWEIKTAASSGGGT